MLCGDTFLGKVHVAQADGESSVRPSAGFILLSGGSRCSNAIDHEHLAIANLAGQQSTCPILIVHVKVVTHCTIAHDTSIGIQAISTQRVDEGDPGVRSWIGSGK